MNTPHQTPARSRARSRVGGWVPLTAVLALALSGCGLGGGIYDMPLPGGADVGANPITITADFDDVVDLVPQSSVKVSNIAVGRVSKIDLNPNSLSARVTLVIRNDLDLPPNTSARLQQSSLLGEKYIALIRPTTTNTTNTTTTNNTGSSTGGVLHDGSHIEIAATSQVAEIEQVLGAVSTVLNGGAIGKFQEISRELQQVADGRPEQIRDFLRTTRVFVAALDSRKDAIATALDSLKDLSVTLEGDKDKIATALEDLSPGMQVLVEQRSQLVAMLGSLDRLSQVTMRTLNASQKDMIEDFKLLEPILKNLAAAGDALPESLQMLLTYPFPDTVLSAIKGDYLNVFVTTNYNTLPAGCAAMGCAWDQLPDEGHMPPVDPSMIGEGSAPAPAVAGALTGQAKSPQAKAVAPSASPSLLPPTDSPLPGIVEPTIQVPKTGGSSDGPSGTPSPSGSASPTATPTEN